MDWAGKNSTSHPHHHRFRFHLQIAPVLAPHPLTVLLLEWYRANARPLPWREAPTPYATWLSEVILQQTRVETGTAYWHRFLERYPTVADLAEAPIDSVMQSWKGLGYYSRARNLHAAAQSIVNDRDGKLPIAAADWRSLPGIGEYTAAAIASICHGEPVPVIDGNVQRVLSRLFDIADAVDRKAGKAAVRHWAEVLVSSDDPGASNQGWMELGATVCKPKNPDCDACPLANACLARQRDTWRERPVKQAKKPPVEVTVQFSVALREVGPLWEWWVERRPDKGIWGGLECFPASMTETRGAQADPGPAWGPVEHILTHRRLTGWFHFHVGQAADRIAESHPEGRWVSVDDPETTWPRMVDKVLPELRARCVKN